MDNELDPNAETIIYDVAGDAIELDDSVEIPERWEDLTESEYTALLDQLGIPSEEQWRTLEMRLDGASSWYLPAYQPVPPFQTHQVPTRKAAPI